MNYRKSEKELREEELSKIEPLRRKGMLDLQKLTKYRVDHKTIILKK